MARAAIWLGLACGTVSCSGATVTNPAAGGGAAGAPVQTAGKSSSDGGTVANAAGPTGSMSAGAGGSSAGKGGASDAGSGGALVAGAGGAEVFTGVLANAPAPGAAWNLPGGDSLNSTPPVLARLGDGVVMGGATTDPKLAGVDAFGPGIVSEAFLAGLDHDGKALWHRPLLPAGLPNAVAVTATQDIVVVAPYLPDETTVSTYLSSDSVYLGKFTANGTPVFEKELKFDSGTRLYALAVDGDGGIWLAGAQTAEFPNESMVLAKYDSSGTEQFVHLFPHNGSTCYVTSLSVNAQGDVAAVGTFNSSFDLGGGALTTQAVLGQDPMPNGFVARFNNAGQHVWSQRFGGPIYDLGNAVAWLPDGDLALAGLVSGAATVGGKTVAAEETHGQAFVARLDGTGKTRWLELADGTARAFAVEAAAGPLHVAGSFSPSDYLHDHDAATGQLSRAAKAVSGAPDATAVAFDGSGSLWLAGSYMDSADFGSQNQLSAASGVFLLRLDRAP